MDGIAEDVQAMQIPYDKHPVETDIAATSYEKTKEQILVNVGLLASVI